MAFVRVEQFGDFFRIIFAVDRDDRATGRDFSLDTLGLRFPDAMRDERLVKRLPIATGGDEASEATRIFDGRFARVAIGRARDSEPRRLEAGFVEIFERFACIFLRRENCRERVAGRFLRRSIELYGHVVFLRASCDAIFYPASELRTREQRTAISTGHRGGEPGSSPSPTESGTRSV